MDLSALKRPVNTWLPTVTYPGYADDLPDIVLGLLPDIMARGRSSPYKMWICETPEELLALEQRFAQPIPMRGDALDFMAGPDGVTAGPSHGGRDFVALYVPPQDGWPWLVVSRWPVEINVGQRGRYTWEIFWGEAQALDYQASVAARTGIAGVLRSTKQ